MRERGSLRRHGRQLDQASAAVEAEVERPRLDGDAEETRRLGRTAAILFGFGAVTSVPSSLLLEPRPALAIYTLTMVAACSALACWVIPWERMGRDWLNVVALAGTVEIAAAMAVADTSYGVYCFFVAIFAGYAIRSHAALFGHFSLISIVLLAPLVYEPETARDTLRQALLFVPGILIAGGTVAYLRDRLEEKQRVYRTFAEEAFELVARIRGKPVRSPSTARTATLPAALRLPTADPSALARLDEISRMGAAIGLGQKPARRPVYRPITLGVLLASLPLLGLFGIAHAGVSLPGPARAPFEALGISLPNQTDDGESTAGSRAQPPAGDADRSPSSGSGWSGATGNAALGPATSSTSVAVYIGGPGGHPTAVYIGGPPPGNHGGSGTPPAGQGGDPGSHPPAQEPPASRPPPDNPYPSRPSPATPAPTTRPPPITTTPTWHGRTGIPPGREGGASPLRGTRAGPQPTTHTENEVIGSDHRPRVPIA